MIKTEPIKLAWRIPDILSIKSHLDQCESLDYIVRHEAVQKMRVGPSESACRS